MSIRIIAKLEVKPPYVVKPVHFEGLRKIGSPEELAEKYYTQGADEIVYLDIVASLYRRPILFEHIQRTAARIMVPFAVGGGVRSLEDFSRLFHLGADKVIINTYALGEDPSLIDRAAKVFGAQAVMLNVEAKRKEKGWECYSDCGRIRSHKDVFAWVREAESRGVGEILLQSVDQDGRKKGFDVELIARVVEQVKIPVIAASGAGSKEDIMEVVEHARPSALALASVLHYNMLTIEEIKEYIAQKYPQDKRKTASQELVNGPVGLSAFVQK